jgi:hypothetical protein
MRVLLELFVEDGMLALSIVGVVLLAIVVASVAPGMTAGAVLIFSSLFALFGNVMAVQKKR